MPSYPQPSPTDKLLTWFEAQRRALPWRDAATGRRDPYRVWLAEVMLQQTTVAAVRPYYEAFLARWPDVKALAEAQDEEVMRAWAGLGYYARARNMLKCARLVAFERQGAFPRAEEDLAALPGIGPYTAAAIAALAFGAPTAPVDGNVIRTLCRLFALEDEMPAHIRLVADKAHALLPEGRSGDFAEALMDLGAGVCRPKNPDCPACPWEADCRARKVGAPQDYPRKAAKKARPTRFGWAFWVERPDGRVLLETRAEKGLLGGMTGFPGGAWTEAGEEARTAALRTWSTAVWEELPGRVTHTFTHFHLSLGVVRVRVGEAEAPQGLWCRPEDLAGQGLPTVMKKVARHVLGPDAFAK